MPTFRLINASDAAGQNWLLEPGTYTMGRDMTCQIVIDDVTASRKHARLEVGQDHYVRVTDLNSRNGVRINRQRLRDQEGQLRTGDWLSLGDVRLLLQSVDAGESSVFNRADLNISEKSPGQSVFGELPVDEALASLSYSDGSVAEAFKALSEIAGMLASHQSLEEMFSEALQRLSRIITGQRYAVLVTNKDTGDIQIAATHLMDPDDSNSFTISRTILRDVRKHKHAVYFSETSGDQRFSGQDSVVLQGIRSAMAVPLIDQDEILGVLYIDTTKSGRPFDKKTLKLAATCGHLLAAKITQHYLLMEQRAKQTLEAELMLASRMQQDLMPIDLPDESQYDFHAHLAQCRLVGGDLYDVGRMPDGRILLLEADIAGKGMGAALLASNLLSAFRILRSQTTFDLLDAVQRASRQLLESSRMSDFATVFIAVLDPRTHRLEYINAGHNPPMFIPAEGEWRPLEYGDLPIGIVPEHDWTVRELTMEPGDRLFIYTDGLIDAANPKGEVYEKEGITRFINKHRNTPPADFMQSLIKELNQFMGDEPPRDDLTMLLAARKSK